MDRVFWDQDRDDWDNRYDLKLLGVWVRLDAIRREREAIQAHILREWQRFQVLRASTKHASSNS